MTTPLKLIHDQIWTMLEANPDFASAVAEPNRIKYYNGIAQPDLDGAMPSRFPSVRVRQTGWRCHVADDSAYHRLWFQWRIEIATGQQKDDRAADISWYCLCTMENWEDATVGLASLTWKGLAFVKDLRALEGGQVLQEQDPLTQGTITWAALWRGEVLHEHKRTDMIDAAQNGS